MLTIVLTRHGSTPRSDPEQHLGQRLDLPLSDAGRTAALALGRRLADVPFDRVLSSPLRRADETARLVCPAAHVETDDRLIEMDYGQWEGLTYAQIDEVDREARRRWQDDPARLPCPGGESGEDVARRVESFLRELVAWAAEVPPHAEAAPLDVADVSSSSADRCVLAVAHSTTNRVLLCVALGVPLVTYRRRFVQAPANLTVLRFAGRFEDGARLLVCNDVAHVKGLRGATWG